MKHFSGDNVYRAGVAGLRKLIGEYEQNTALHKKYRRTEQHFERFRTFICPDIPSVEALIKRDHFDSSAPKYDCLAMVLKAHLLFEEVLTGIVTDALNITELPSPNSGGLTFVQKLRLAELIITQHPQSSKNTRSLKLVDELNQVRNRLAHHLHEDLDFEKEWNKILLKFEGPKQKEDTLVEASEPERRMLAALWHTYAVLALERVVIHQTRLFIEDD